MANYKALACLLNSCSADVKKRITHARMVYLKIRRTSFSLAYHASFALRKSPSQSLFCATQYFFIRTGTGVPNPHEIMSRSGFTFVWCGVMALIVSRNISSVMQLRCVIISLIQCNFKKIWKFNKLQIRFG